MSLIDEALTSVAEDISSSRLSWPDANEDQLAFMQRVYDINQRWSARNGTFIGDIPSDQLGTIEDNHKAKTEAAIACKELLAAARQAISTAAVNVKVGLTSAYRSATRQLSLWQSYFPDYYETTRAHRESLAGGAHGEEAANYLGTFIRSKVAIPGYSNHQNGIAVDLLNIENGKKIANKTKSPFPAEWRETWFWSWLENNANRFGFYQNNSINEPWHWEYKKKESGNNETYEDYDYIEEDISSAPALLRRETTPASETLYVGIDLGMTQERIYKTTDSRNDTAPVEKMTGIFIPKNFTAASEVDLLIYLNGHKSSALGKDKSIDKYWKASLFPHFAFREFLNDSGRQIILVAPTLGPRSQSGTLTTNSGFTDFMDQVISAINQYSSLYTGKTAPSIKSIILACHSGGGSPMRKIALLAGANRYADKINDCWGFDCTYSSADADEWTKWAKADSNRSLYIYFIKNSDTDLHATALKRSAGSLANVHVEISAEDDHNSVPKKYFPSLLRGGVVVPTMAHEIAEYSRYRRRRPLVSLARDLFYRRYISYPIYIAISNGERDPDRLTDMVFAYRYPGFSGWGSMFGSSGTDYYRYKNEWNDIRSKIIEPLVDSDDGGGTETEMANVGGRNNETVDRDDPLGRQKWFYSVRLPEGGGSGQSRPYYAMATEKVRRSTGGGEMIASLESLLDIEARPGRAGTNNWTPIGPSVIGNGQATNLPPVSGRITSFAIGSHGNRLYVGTANGGVWYSGDRGNTWEPWWGYDTTSDADLDSGNRADSLSIGSVAVIFGNSKTLDEVYVGTGEAFSNFDAYFGVGIKHYRSGTLTLEDTDEKRRPEASRVAANLLAGAGIYRLTIDPSSTTNVFAATTKGLFKRKSTGSWERLTGSAATPFTSPNSSATDFVITGTGNTKKHYVAFQSDGVYEANHNLTTWTKLTALPTGQRIALAAGTANNAPLYAMLANGALYRLHSGAFSQVSGVPTVFNNGSGWYALTIAVDPSDANTVYIAGDFIMFPSNAFDLSLYRGRISGAAPPFSFSANTNAAHADPRRDSRFLGTGIHPDSHCIGFSRDNSGNVQTWVGTDGGLFYSDRPTTNGTYVQRNVGVSSAQVNYIAQRVDMDTFMIAGTQDNGTIRYWGDQVWHEDPQGDGGGVAIDPDPSKQYNLMRQYLRASLSRSTDGGKTWSGCSPGPLASGENSNTNTAFYGPIEAFYSSGASQTMVAYGTDRLWLSINWGSSWRSLPNNTTADRNVGNPIIAIRIVSRIAILAATTNTVFRYTLAGLTWVRTAITNAGLPAGYAITAIAPDDNAGLSFYVSLGGSGNFSRCYHFDGATWRAAGPDRNTLNIPSSAIVVDSKAPRHIYLGSDVGVWKGTRGANAWTVNWVHYSQGLPESAIVDLIIHDKARLLRAATHGRGVWEILIDATSGNPVDIYLRANPADSGRMLAGSRFSWIKTAEDPTRTTAASRSTVTLNMSPDIKIRRATLGAYTGELSHYAFNYLLRDQTTSNNWQSADRAGTNQVFIQLHNRGLDKLTGTNIRVVLLMADVSSGSLPALPAGFTALINGTRNLTTVWPASSNWRLADTTPSRILSGNLSVRIPLIAQFNVNFSSFPATTRTVGLLALITTLDRTDALTGTTTNVEDLIMADKHVALRYVSLI